MNDLETRGMGSIGFLVMAFTDEKAGDNALKAMETAKKKGQFYFENAAVVRQDTKGKVHYRETGDMQTRQGAGMGALVGGVFGILGGPAGVVLGASAGAAMVAGIAQVDEGFKNKNLKTVGIALKPGTSAVASITSEYYLKPLRKEVPMEEIQQIVRSLGAAISGRLDEGMNVALSLIREDTGLAFKELAVDDDAARLVDQMLAKDAI
jgi:uncharacterized membrane protein